MSIINGIIKAPVSIYDIQQVLGISGGGNIGKIILSARAGGSIAPGEDWKQAFWTREHYKEGIVSIGHLIKGSEPYFNIFSEKSPVEWAVLGEELWVVLKKAVYIPEFVNINGVSTRITYSFTQEFFDGYNHNEIKCELGNPADFISTSSTKNIDIVYSIPRWFMDKLPELNTKSYFILSDFLPGDYEDIKNLNFIAFSNINDNHGDFIFQSRLTGLPVYKDQNRKITWYVSVWDWVGDPNYPNAGPEISDNIVKYWKFKFKMPDIGKAYTAITNVTGGLDRPNPIITMFIDVRIDGNLMSGSYERTNTNTIQILLIEMEIRVENAELWCDDNNFKVADIPFGYYPQYRINNVNFPTQNFDNFSIRSRY